MGFFNKSKNKIDHKKLNKSIPAPAAMLEQLEPRIMLNGATGPTAQEQYMLELINRARQDPAAEVALWDGSYWTGTADLNEGLAAGTITANAKQPLAFNLNLIDASRSHSQWMLDNNIFSHTGQGGSTSFQRMETAGFAFVVPYSAGENLGYQGTTGQYDLNTYVSDIQGNLFGDADFAGRGHRLSLMNGEFREIGIGIKEGVFFDNGTNYNSVMATQDFADSGTTVFLTGVAYADTNADNFYQPTEAIGGVNIVATRQSDSQQFQITSWDSGGYTLALPGGTYNITASGPYMAQALNINNVVIGDQNVKVDFLGELADLGSIAGVVWNDPNINATNDAGEPGLASRKVYLDANGNSQHDQGEAFTTTDAGGRFEFTGLLAGTYNLKMELSVGFAMVAAPDPIILAEGQDVTGEDFFNVQAASIAGTIINDENSNGLWDVSEIGMVGQRVFVDDNTNGELDQGEASAVTAGDGSYSLTGLLPGTHKVLWLHGDKFNQTAPSGDGSHTVSLTAGQQATPYLFAGQELFPEIDVEIGENPGLINTDFGDTLIGSTKTLTLTIRNEGDYVLTVSKASGLALPFAVQPANLANNVGDNWVIAAGLTRDIDITFSPTVLGSVGDILFLESDDPNESSYQITLTGVGATAVAPTANEDALTVDEDSAATAIDVLANDNTDPEVGETISITGVTQPDHGTVVVTGSGTGLTYQPDENFNGTDIFTYTIIDDDGLTDEGTVTVIVTPQPDDIEMTDMPTIYAKRSEAPTAINLFRYFDKTDEVYFRFVSNMGTIGVEMFPNQTPITVANFQRYVNAGRYSSTIIHRSVSNFIIQGGGFALAEGLPGIETYDPIQNEYGISNTRGTIAMAKLGGDPDSATNQWFFNLADNSGNLDNQNGGFTVFGEVVSGMDVVDAIAALPISDLTQFFGGTFGAIPLIGGIGSYDNIVTMYDILEYDQLTFEVVGNTNENLLSCSIDGNGILKITYAPNAAGVAEVTIRATDADSVSVEQTFTVNVALPDLSVTEVTTTLPGSPLAGTAGTAIVTIANNDADGYVSQPVGIQVWAVIDGNEDVLLANKTVSMSIGIDGTKRYYVPINLPINMSNGNYSIVAVVDSGQVVTELNEENNTHAAAGTINVREPFVDLTPEITQQTFANLVTGHNYGKVKVTVTNNGNIKASGPLSIQIWASADGDITAGDDDMLLATRNTAVSLYPGRQYSYWVTVTIPNNLIAGTYDIVAVVDSNNNLLEANGGEDNNTASVPGALAVQNPDISTGFGRIYLRSAPLAGSKSKAYVTITNESDVRVYAKADIQVWMTTDGDLDDGSGDYLLGKLDNKLIYLRGGQTRQYRVYLTLPPGMAIGDYQLMSVVDANYDIAESNEDNNTALTPADSKYRLRDPFIDLTATISATRIADAVTGGNRALVRVNIANNGNINAIGTMNIQLWASATGVDDFLLIEKPTRIYLRPDAQRGYWVKFKIPSNLVAGTYDIVAVIDSNNDFLEANGGEDNNTTAPAPGALVMQNPDLSTGFGKIYLHSALLVGSKGRAYVTITNESDVRVYTRADIQVWMTADGDLSVGGDDYLVGQLDNKLIYLLSGRTRQYRVNLTLPQDIAIGDYQLMSVVDANYDIAESNEDNNIALTPADSKYRLRDPFVDLTATIGATRIADMLTGAKRALVRVDITNNGNISIIDTVNVQLWAIADGVDDFLLIEKPTRIYLRPDGKRGYWIKFTVANNLLAGTYDIVAVVDSNNNLLEANGGEDNNTTAPASGALVVQNSDLSTGFGRIYLPSAPLAGSQSKAYVTITNESDVRVYAKADIQVWMTTDGDLSAGGDDYLVGQLDNKLIYLLGGRTRQYRVYLTLPQDIAIGDYQLMSVVDANYDIAETNEDNNTALTPTNSKYRLRDPFVDLVPNIGENRIPASVSGGERAWVRVNVANNGNIKAIGPMNIQLWASADGDLTVGVDDFLIAERLTSVAILPDGQYGYWVLATIPQGLPAGIYSLLASIDTNNNIAENIAGELNNIAVVTNAFTMSA